MNKSTTRALAVVLCCLLALTLLPSMFAQEVTAGIQGVVKDPSGAMVSKATVEVSGPALIGTRKGETDTGGAYFFSHLPPGDYTITVSAAGFRTYKQSGLTLTTGSMPTVDIQLQVGTVSETVEVTGAAPLVDVTQSKVSVTVERDQLNALPQGRSFQSLIPFAPGARQEPMQGARGNRTNGFQIDGASDGENVYLIDGVNTTNIQDGGVGKNFQGDFIQEVQIKSSSFEAEFGGALGGVVNAVPKRGSNAWHGELKTYMQFSSLDANDPCADGFTAAFGGNLVCNQRLNPSLPGLNSGTRLDGTPEYYIPKKDQRSIIEPGYEVGGPLFRDRLWIFSSFIPSFDTTNRTTTFTGANKGPRRLVHTNYQYNAYNRLDYRMFNSLRLFAGWNYAYSRITGALGNPDGAYGQVNTGATTDPTTLRADSGSVNPLAVWTFGGDWTPTSKLVVTGRFGYFFNNSESRGIPSGTRYIYDATVNASSVDLAGAAYPASAFNTNGFASIPSNFTTLFNPFKRKSLNFDGSYFIGHAWGSHTLKTGYFWQHQSNVVSTTANTSWVNLEWNLIYSPVTSATACNSIQAANLTAGLVDKTGAGICAGRYGYFFTGTTTTSQSGGSTQTAQAWYIQDAWTVGHGLTLNLGLRLDQETMPAYDPTRFPSVHFGWGDKLAPRIGGAYDLLHNGKVKIYASYGMFFDIMKMGLARGSFGSDYWHECLYTLDFTDYTTITPTGGAAAPGGCPASGPAPGVTVGRFIENVDFRATKADPRDPAIMANMKPMKQHEFVTGVDWAITPNWSLETRYSRKRLDNTIEDMSITDNLGFYIGNPGTSFADVLHRPVILDSAVGLVGPFCAECPPTIKPIRRYDGLEFRLTRRAGTKWYGSISYTYSKLRGNYPGLTNSDATDGNGGRHSPNNSRLFDLPTMTYLPNGKIDDGPLSTDRPHTAKMFGYYRLKWLGMETTLGATQSAFQGSPISSCLPVVGTASACQWAEGRGNFVKFHRDASGNLVKDGVVNNARTSPYLQTDFSLVHEIKVSKAHENYRLRFEGNAYNLFNNRSATSYYELVIPANLISPTRAVSRFSGDPQVDWNKVMTSYNYIDALNGTGSFGGGVQAPLTLASRYGLPQTWQTARQFRLAIRFVF